MILKADLIAKLLDEGDTPGTDDPFVVMPRPDTRKLAESGAASIDLRLGTWFLTLREGRMTCLEIGEPSPHLRLTDVHHVPLGGKYILHPRSFVLGITLEWIRLKRDMAGYLIGKSSWGRRGLIIATAAGVHPGFMGCLTLELSNVGEIPTAISPGMRICQLFLHELKSEDLKSGDRSGFVGQRKPSLGDVQLDDMARLLRASYASRSDSGT